MAKRVLFTGHGGFVGHHCLEYFLANTDWEFVCIDSFRHKGTCRRVVEIGGDNPRVKTHKHDLSVPIDAVLEKLIRPCEPVHGVKDPITGMTHYFQKPIDIIINMASESAVERSTSDPVSCLRNNFDLSVNMLEFARRCPSLELFIQISTDEVYGEAPPNGAHTEWSPILPSNPYAASKAAQEAVAISYWRTYNLPIVLINCMNLIGERQDPEKFLPKLIQKIAKEEEMPIYADSENKIGSRYYLHAKNLADALIFISKMKPQRYSEVVKLLTCSPPDKTMTQLQYEMLTHEMIRPDRYNVAGSTELNNLELAQMVARLMGKELKYKLVSSESARPGYDRRYALDGRKLRNRGWEQPISFEQSIEQIVKWTMENPHWM